MSEACTLSSPLGTAVTDVRIASYNVENLFARPRRLLQPTRPRVKQPSKLMLSFNALIAKAHYSAHDRQWSGESQLGVRLSRYLVLHPCRSRAP